MSYHHKGPRKYHGSMGDDVLDLFYETDQSEKSRWRSFAKTLFRERLVLRLSSCFSTAGIHSFAPFKLVNLPILPFMPVGKPPF